MNNYRSVKEYNQSIQKKLSEIAKPLEDNLSIRFLTYRRFYNDGNLLYLFNHEQWMDYVLGSSNWVSSSFKKKIKLTTEQALIDNVWSEKVDHEDPILGSLYAHDIWHGISVYIKHNSYIESFAFAGTRATPQVLDIYSNHHYVLDHFRKYFYVQAKPLIDGYDRKLLIPFSLEEMMAPSDLNKKIEKFMQETSLNQIPLFLGGERYCAFQKGNGLSGGVCLWRTAKQIARRLGISFKTVETHLEHAKQKTDCQSKSDMIKVVMQNNDFRYLVGKT
ncbi:helix-turn-helix transcriptional regulator [Candidatus Finniella inopinata]|uniref:HTH luxR-type domain-containing protein n=1 Tax=Candidatus Finniella inopinata TaxID=1696036 RepID=A0A4V2E002_9PROT|nr:LuxR C-terminal-related transcriptional regulator [Candidatus Finniella inopinata]RZI46847.1 hypothetical protein EQU50_01075 [Candidatus Finniella inopinata]